MRFVRSLRGLAGIALIWGVAWGTVLGLVDVIVWITITRNYPVHLPLALSLLGRWIWGFSIGAIAGISFSVLLGLVERKRSVTSLSVARTAVWGAIGSAVFAGPSVFLWAGARSMPLPGIELLLSAAVFAALGAGAAGATLMVAQRAKPLPSEAKVDLLTV